MDSELVDGFGRRHTYLRVSVTDRCNYRCVYCMPQEGLKWAPRSDVLSYEEIVALVRVFVGLGITHVRLTGGEPTMRSNFVTLVSALNGIEGLSDLSMTTNGHTLAKLSEPLARAGLNRINVSLDTLDPHRFEMITRGGDLRLVLKGISSAVAAGLAPIKINTVLLKGQNDDEILDLVHFFANHEGEFQLRFIEYMPFVARWHECVSASQVMDTISSRYSLEATSSKGQGPAKTYVIKELGLKVGFISPLSQKFCSTCNRLRLMLNGHLRTCLAHEDTPSLRDLLRKGGGQSAIAAAIVSMVSGKPEGHNCEIDGGEPFQGVMTAIGG